ncbi:hypothetical protein DE146DRAFT_328967 [Phaeosphaeria sp. MPI-PUGE-AT-0046c]|nr:hypothetical protein DE146DRAFT_328967 [Phaeosphaeria sp. MPI-PUGE-AT-0046c]
MPPALDRLLASPSALRLLRCIVNGPGEPEVLASCPAFSHHCCHQTKHRRPYATKRTIQPKPAWRTWHESPENSAKRDQIRQFLEANELSPAQHSKDPLQAIIHGQGTNEASKTNAEKWAALLSRRERQEGHRGVMAVWKLRQQAQYRLPTDDTQYSEYLWGTFVKHADLVQQVIDHAAELARDSTQTYPRLYTLIMVYWLSRDMKRALEYHYSMLMKLDLKTIPLKEVVRSGRPAFKVAAYELLLDVYRASEPQALYDEVVPPLIESNHIVMARRWHNLCLFKGDLPSERIAHHPVVRVFTAETSELSESSAATNDSTKRDARYNGDLMRRLLGRDTAPVRFEDSFCAKMFATQTFPPTSVIKGLAMVGVNEIGPQAVQAMASRTEPLQALPAMFEKLKAHGIALQGCVYSLAIEKFANERNWDLVRSMLQSDQHPDVFGDAIVQRKLLHFYLSHDDHAQAQRTLAILTLFHNDSSQESWNLLLQTHVSRSEPQHVAKVLQDMRVHGVMVNVESIAAIKTILRHRQHAHKPSRPTNREFDDLRFVTRILMTILEFGIGNVSPGMWREIIRRFGMTGRFRELRRLLLWLLCWYAPRSSYQFAHLPASPFRERALERLRTAYPGGNHFFNFPNTVLQREDTTHPIRELFPPALIQALIIWGFRAGLLPNTPLEQSLYGPTLAKKHYRRRLLRQQILQRATWSIGLRTVVLLRDLGVTIHNHTVVKALQMQFVVLFGHGRSSNIENRVMEDVNPVPYSHYVREVNMYWGRPLLREPRLFHRGMIHDHMWHPRMRRKVDRKPSINLIEILGSDWLNDETESVTRYAEAATDDAAYKELLRTFEAQATAMNPDTGAEWLHEASVDITGSARKGRRVRRPPATVRRPLQSFRRPLRKP